MEEKIVSAGFNIVVGDTGQKIIIIKKKIVKKVETIRRDPPKVIVDCAREYEEKASKKGRKKKKNTTKIAKCIECDGEFCYKCDRVRVVKDNPLQPYLWCLEFERELAPAFNDSVAERCANCHLAERYANGSNIYI